MVSLHVQYVGHIGHVLHVWNLHISRVRVRVRVGVCVCPYVFVCVRECPNVFACVRSDKFTDTMSLQTRYVYKTKQNNDSKFTDK